MCVDRASRFQRPYGTRDKAHRPSSEWCRGSLPTWEFHGHSGRIPEPSSPTRRSWNWNSLQIRRELTAPYTPQQNGPVESGLSRAIKAGHAARIEVNRSCLVGFGRVQALRDYGKQRHALPVRDILREPPAGAGLAVLQASVPSRPAARKTGRSGAAVLFPTLRLQPQQ